MDSLRWLVGMTSPDVSENENCADDSVSEIEQSFQHSNIENADCESHTHNIVEASNETITTDWLVVVDGEEETNQTPTTIEVEDILVKQRAPHSQLSEHSRRLEDSLIENPLITTRASVSLRGSLSYAHVAKPTMKQQLDLERRQEVEYNAFLSRHIEPRYQWDHHHQDQYYCSDEGSAADDSDIMECNTFHHEQTWTSYPEKQQMVPYSQHRVAAQKSYGMCDALDWCADTRVTRRHTSRTHRLKNFSKF